MHNQNQNERVIHYYRATMRDYETVWYNQKNLGIHFGYYDQNTRKHSDSLTRINAVFSEMAKITKDDYILDAGCGVGGSAIWLAKNRGCKVMGINIVPLQLQKAVIYTSANDVTDLVTYELQDYTATTYTDNTFTGVWAQESVCHTDKKDKFCKEAYRVLKENGRLLMAEYTFRENHQFTQKEQRVVNEWLEGWSMHSLLTVSEYEQLLKQAGFQRIEVHDITEHVIPSLRKLSRISFLAAIVLRMLLKFTWLTPKSPRLLAQCKNIIASYSQYIAFKKGMTQYSVIIAYKN